jgi:hypothetical protein
MNKKKVFSLIIITLVFSIAMLHYNLYLDYQKLLKQRISSMVHHIDSAEHSLRLLESGNMSPYERYLALFSIRNFKSEVSALGNQFDVHINNQWPTDGLVNGGFQDIFAHLENIKKTGNYLRDLSKKKFLHKSEIKRVLENIRPLMEN